MTAAPSAMDRRRQKVRERGLMRFAWEATQRRVYHQIVSAYVERDLSPIKRRYRLRDEFQVRIALDLAERNCTKHFPGHWPAYRRMLESGCVPSAAFHGEDMVGILWWSEKEYWDDDVYKYRFPVEEDQAYQFAGELAMAYRRSAPSITPAVIDRGWAFCRERGKRRAYSIVNIENTASVRLHNRTGFQEVGRKLVTRSVLGWTWSREAAYEGSLMKRSTPRADPDAGRI